MKTREMTLCAMFTVLIAVGASIKMPIPVVPFTLQTFFVAMSGIILGGRLGAISATCYMLIGLAGVPVFAQGGGISYVLQPSFGYIVGFIAGAYVIGKLASGNNVSIKRLLVANFAGLFIVYIFGMIYYYIIGNFVINSPIGVGALFWYCFVLVVPGDAVLSVIAAIMGKKLKPAVGAMMHS